ncbi:hypothetical protein RJ639_024032 [Escallonia herrerae]|uniref:Uncharacterized protein n=1 Tax=Escallonia herrerae TaxID=1293975 RepID=A0AA88V145_9ASTE|nr:hypothetical protein RJ639_024032 [Escallonia herrerae]
MFRKILGAVACGNGGKSKKKIRGTVVLMKKNVLDFNDFNASVLDRMIVKQLFASLSSKKWDSNQGKCNILLWNVESWGSLPSQSHKRLLMQDQTGYEEKCLGQENPSNSVLNGGQHQDEVAKVDA